MVYGSGSVAERPDGAVEWVSSHTLQAGETPSLLWCISLWHCISCGLIRTTRGVLQPEGLAWSITRDETATIAELVFQM